MTITSSIHYQIFRPLLIAIVVISISLSPWTGGSVGGAAACPFCSSVAMTFTDQLSGQDVVVSAKLVEVPELPETPGEDLPKATFEITKVLKGKEYVDVGMTFKALLVGRYKPGKEFLVMGVDPPSIVWTTPIKASKRLIKYLVDIQTLPESGADRLAFFQDYFEDEVSSIAFDAYDEFAKAPYSDLVDLKDRMHRDKLMAWVKDPELAINRRRLYLTMLGVCGTAQDGDELEKMIQKGGSSNLRGLDALVASYLSLKGEAGVDLVEQKFLRNEKSEFTDTMAAVSALRFHATEVEVVDKQKIVSAVRALLDRPKMADLIIPDLARWEDWSVMDKLVSMFKESDDDKRWLRVPIVSYLIACPLPEAKVHLAELTALDPDAVKRANLFGQGFDDDDDDEEEEADEAEAVETEKVSSSDKVTSVPVVAYKIPIDGWAESSESAGSSEFSAPSNLTTPNVSMNVDQSDDVATASDVAQTNGTEVTGQPPVAAMVPYLALKIVFIPLIISIALFVLLWSVVSGSFQRLIF
ncbi:hypothetical protein OAG71_01985 [bacterium]|nr:hypothetical protein [bacterium]